MDDIWSTLSQRVRERIGRPLPERPDAADPQFLRLLSELRRADALLAEQVIGAFTGTDQRLPSEEDAEAERRRRRVRARLFARFFRPDGLRTGRLRFHFRKAVHWAGALIAIAIVIWSAIPRRGDVPPASARAQVTVTDPARPPATVPATSSDRANGPGLSLRAPDHAQAPALYRAPVPLPVIPPGGFPPSTRTGLTSRAIPGVSPPMDRVASSVIVYETGTAAADASPVVYEFAGSEQSGRVPGRTAGGADSADPQQRGAAVVVYDAQAARAPGATPVPGTIDATTADPSSQGPRTGQLLQAALITPVTVSSAGGPTPALAEITEGPLQGAALFGQAARTPDGLVSIQFTMLISKDGQEARFNAMAYDAAVGRLGIAGQVSTMMPGAASAMTAATMQAASDYFRARAQQQQVTVTNGFLSITQGVPTFWESLAATTAKAFTPAASSTAGPSVVTRLERGRTITVMVI